MVRIRSDRWYSGENQKELRRIAPSNSNGTRRLISLVFLLALVLMLMAKVSDPKNMRQIFDSLGIPLQQDVVATTHPTTAGQQHLSGAGDNLSVGSEATPSEATPWDKTCADLIPRVLEKASSQQIDRLAEYWFAAKSKRAMGDDAEVTLDFESASLIQQLREKLDGNSSSDLPWSDLLTRFENRWQSVLVEARLFHQSQDQSQADAGSGPTDAKLPVDEFHRRLSDYLDRSLLENLRDGSPWNAGELVGFGRLLQRAKNFQFGKEDPPLVATKQLEGEFLKLRGSWVRFRATVRLIEQVEREQPLVDQANYSVLWLRGFDGSTLPIAVYTTSSIVNQLKRSISPQSYPEVEIIGLVGKKLAYASASGVEVTPTLFAGSIVQFAPDLAEQLSPEAGSLSRQVGIAGIAALVLSLLAAVFLWKQLRTKNNIRQGRGPLKLPIILWLIVASTVQSSPLWAQEPPWKSSLQPDKIKVQVVQQRLASAFSEDQLQLILQLIGGEDTQIPDSILRSLFALNQVGWNAVWQVGQPIELTSNDQLKPVEIAGWAWSVQPLALSSQQKEWFSLQPTQHIYRIQVQPATDRGQQPPELISVFCLDVPKPWKESVQLKQPIQLNCFSFSHALEGSPEGKPLFYFAERASWKISDTDVLKLKDFHPTIPANWLDLAALGWDLAWFDLLAANNQKRLSIEETEPLLKLLEITQRTAGGLSLTQLTPTDTPSSSAPEPAGKVALVSPIDSMRKPLENLLAPIDWQVRLVSGSVVELKQTKYYQLDGFVKIPNQTVNYTIPDTRQSLTFENEFPVTIVTRYDRQFVPLDKLNSGEQTWQIGKTARVRGRFLRLWSYESQRLSTAGSSSRQVAPLVVAGQLTEDSALPEVSPRSLWGVALLGCAMVGVMLWVLKDFSKRKPSRRNRV